MVTLSVSIPDSLGAVNGGAVNGGAVNGGAVNGVQAVRDDQWAREWKAYH